MNREGDLGRQAARWLAISGLCTALAAGVSAGEDTDAAESPATQPATQPTTAPASIERAFIVPIVNAIDGLTYDIMDRRLNKVLDQKPELIIIELDTPGGVLDETLEICNRIKRLRDDGVKVYAWVNDEAYSAGTIIALATDGILMSRNATIGDCQPIMIRGGGASAVPEELEAKATSPLIEELEDSIRRNGYDHDMVLALIRPEMEIYWVENRQTGERRFVTPEVRDELFGWSKRDGPLDRLLGSAKPDKSQTDWEYLTRHEELGEIRQPIVEENRTLLTMRTPKAIAYGFCQGVVQDLDDLKAHFNITGQVHRLEDTGPETVIQWLASPVVRGILFMLMLLGAYVEFKTPGFGVGGTCALVALIVFLGAPYLVGLAVTWEIVAVLVGIGLLALEVFVIPGFGLAGILGFIVLGIGLLATYVPPGAIPQSDGFWHLPSLSEAADYLRRGLASMAGGMVGSIIGMVLLARYLPRSPMGAYLIAPNPEPASLHSDDPYEGFALVGDIGLTESRLRPAGKARFGSKLVDVVSRGEFLDRAVRVRVVERRGNRVVVEAVDQA